MPGFCGGGSSFCLLAKFSNENTPYEEELLAGARLTDTGEGICDWD